MQHAPADDCIASERCSHQRGHAAEAWCLPRSLAAWREAGPHSARRRSVVDAGPAAIKDRLRNGGAGRMTQSNGVKSLDLANAQLPAVQAAEAKLLLQTHERNPILFVGGEGVHIIDEQGNRYLDLLSGIGVNALGYGHPAIERAIAEQSHKLLHISNLFFHTGQAELAARLTEKTGMDRAFFCNSGTEAWEAALKLARSYAGVKRGEGRNVGTKFLALEHSFHGRTMGSVSTTHKLRYREAFAPLVPAV